MMKDDATITGLPLKDALVGNLALGVDSIGDAAVMQLTHTGALHVCLCDLEDKPVGDGPFPYAELCEKHGNAAKLESLVKAGLSVLLHVQNKDGDIVPVEV